MRSVLLAGLLLLSTMLLPAAAAPARQTVRVGYFSFPSFQDVDENGRYSGYGYEYLQELAKYTGWQYEYVSGTWEACLDMLERGEIDLLGSAQRTPQREERYDFPQLESGVSYATLFARVEDTSLAYEDFDAFDGMTVGLMESNSRNGQLDDYCKENGFEVSTKLYPDQNTLLKALHSGHVDAVLTSNLRKTDDERVIGRFSPSPFYFITTKGNQTILDGLNNAQDQIKLANPYFDEQLYQNYYAASLEELVFNQEERTYLDGLEPLRCAYNESYSPIEYQDTETGAFRGVTADLFTRFSQATGVAFTFVPSPSLEASARMLKAGEVDLICGFDQDFTWSDRYDVRLTSPYLTAYNLLITNPGQDNNAPVAMTADNLPELQYQLQGIGTKILYYPTTQACFEAVSSGEAGSTYANIYTAHQLMQERRFSHLDTTASVAIRNELCIALSRQSDPRLFSILNKAVLHLSSTELDEVIIRNTAVTRPFTLEDYISNHPIQVLVMCVLVFLMIIAVLTYVLLQRGRHNQRIHDLLYTDSLTGVWNYNRFCLEAAKRLATAEGQTYALVYSDIERFQYFNDVFGYEQGDLVLRRVAQELTSFLEQGECFARIANDNFIALVKFSTKEAFEQRIDAVNQHLGNVHKDGKERHRLTLISGVCVIPSGEKQELSALIDCANAARKTVKGAYKSSYAYYDDQLRQFMQARQEIESGMDRALEEGQFIPYLQPQFDFKTGRIVGMEALVRWQHPKRGLVPPGVFIPLFEENGFVVDVDFSMFEQCCKLLAGWLGAGQAYVPLSCNFSRLHLRRADFVSRLCTLADRYSVPHELLQLEITESAVEGSQEQLVDVLKALKKLGFGLSMDDFGSGYSSLNILKLLPVDELKLDKDFLQRSFIGYKDRIIIEGFVTIAKRLKLTVVCEGVETEEQAEFLRGIGCHVAQGFLYARPMPVVDAERMLRENHSISPGNETPGWEIPAGYRLTGGNIQ